jgi:hypothetical protein
MKKMGLGILFLILIFINCGRNPSNINSEPDANVIKYRITSVVTSVVNEGNIAFPVSYGDTMRGYINYNTNAADFYPNDTATGYYYPDSESQGHFTLGNFTFNSFGSGSPSGSSHDTNYIKTVFIVHNNQSYYDTNGFPITHEDIFHWYAHDSISAKNQNVGDIFISLEMQDTSMSAFNSKELPRDINIDDFNNVYLWIGATDSIAGSMQWQIYTRIISWEKE